MTKVKVTFTVNVPSEIDSYSDMNWFVKQRMAAACEGNVDDMNDLLDDLSMEPVDELQT